MIVEKQNVCTRWAISAAIELDYLYLLLLDGKLSFVAKAGRHHLCLDCERELRASHVHADLGALLLFIAANENAY